MKKRRREAQSADTSFMDCICCGFGAVLLLFILTAKNQIEFNQMNVKEAAEAAETLRIALEQAEAKDKALDEEIEALDPKPDTNATQLAELAAEQERLAKEIEDQAEALKALETAEVKTEQPAGLDRPSADQSYLAGLRLRGPRIAILLESSGSMLAEDAQRALSVLQGGQAASAEKWLRAKAATRAVLAAIPKGNQVAIFHANESTTAISGSPQNPYIDPYDNAALLATLDRLDRLEANGGTNMQIAMGTLNGLRQKPSSLLIIGDGLPSSPAPSGGVTEAYRVQLFNRAFSQRFPFAINSILFPFAGDPAAAGLFWQLTGRTGGITLIPDEDWPSP